MAAFMITVRAISAGAFGGDLGATRYLVVPDNTAPAPAHAVSRTDWVRQVMQTFPRAATGVSVGNLLVFVHGFNEAIVSAECNLPKSAE